MAQTSHIEVDLVALDHNLAVIRRVIGPNRRLCAVLKADAYGLGAVRVAKRLALRRVDMLAVYTLDQARDLLDASIALPILVLMPAEDFDRADSVYRAAAQGRLQLTVHDEASLRAAAELGERLGIPLAVHIELDSGMARGGRGPEEATELVRGVLGHTRLLLAGLSSHFASGASSELMTFEQAAVFAEWVESLGDLVPDECMLHIANTGGTFRSDALHATMVRVGAGLFGYAAFAFPANAEPQFADEAESLRPVVRWLSRVIHVGRVDSGRTVGYGGAWRATRPTRVGLVPVGYADGYPLSLSSDLRQGLPGRCTAVRVRFDSAQGEPSWHEAQVIGRVSMDQLTIDLTDLPESVGLGAEVELFSADASAANALPALAQAAGSSVYELMCRMSPKIERRYLAVEPERSSFPVVPRAPRVPAPV
ncbi:MAG: alanine racemase [Planctomycetota bacterium]